MAGRGGARRGAGRKPNMQDKIKEAAKTLAAHAGDMSGHVPPEIAAMSPLQVMLKAMSLEAAKGDWPKAAGLAGIAAPFVHPKLAAVEMNAHVRRSVEDLTTEELIALAGEGEGEE